MSALALWFHQQPHGCANNVMWLIRACYLLFKVPELFQQQIGHMATLLCDYLLIADRAQIFEFGLTDSQATACLRSYKSGLFPLAQILQINVW